MAWIVLPKNANDSASNAAKIIGFMARKGHNTGREELSIRRATHHPRSTQVIF
jgi:hypothetical protein